MSSKPTNPLNGISGVNAYAPDYALKKKIGNDVDLRRDVFTEDRMAMSQQVIDEAAGEFFDDAAEDVEWMHTACGRIEKGGEGDIETMKEIGQRAHRLKGQAETLGFGLVAKVGSSLSNYCQAQRSADETAVIVVRKHVDTLRVAFHQRLEGTGGEVGGELIQSLEKLIRKFSRV